MTRACRVRRPACRALASIAATLSAFRLCWRRSSATKALRAAARRRQLGGAGFGRGRELPQLRVACGEPLGQCCELLAGLARLLDDPRALVRGARDAVEPCERLVDRVGAEQDRERVALVGLLVEGADELRQLRSPCRAPRAGRSEAASARARAPAPPPIAGRRACRARPGRGRAPPRARRARASQPSRGPRVSGRRTAARPPASEARTRLPRERRERAQPAEDRSWQPRLAPHASSKSSPRGVGP